MAPEWMLNDSRTRMFNVAAARLGDSRAHKGLLGVPDVVVFPGSLETTGRTISGVALARDPSVAEYKVSSNGNPADFPADVVEAII